MSLSRIRSKIEALERKLALPLAVVKLRPLAEEFCDQWEVAKDAKKPLPQAHPFIQRIAGKGVRLNTFTNLPPYFRRCQENKESPDASEIVKTLLPQAYKFSIIEPAFRFDAPATA